MAAGAYRVWRSGQAIADGDGSKRLNGTASVDSVATEGYDELSSAAKLALWCVTGGLAIKLGDIAAGDSASFVGAHRGVSLIFFASET